MAVRPEGEGRAVREQGRARPDRAVDLRCVRGRGRDLADVRGEGQRDDAAIAAVVEALKFQGAIGRAVIEKRVRGSGARI